LKVSRRTLQRWRHEGGGPPFIRMGLRRIAYRLDAIEQWTAGNTFASGAAELAADMPVVADVFTDEREARLWEIAENLHRAELTAQERADHIAEWVRLTEAKVAQLAPPAGGLQPKEQGIRKATREIGIDRTEAQRAIKIAAIAPEAKQAARDAGLDDDQSALLTIARAPMAEQVAAVRDIVERKAAPEIEPELRKSAAAELADPISDHVPPRFIPRVRELLMTVAPHAVAKELA